MVAIFFVSNKYVDIKNTQKEIHTDYENIDAKLDTVSAKLEEVTKTIEKEEIAKVEKEKVEKEVKEKEIKETIAKEKEVKADLDEKDKKIAKLEQQVKAHSQSANRSSLSRNIPDKSSEAPKQDTPKTDTSSSGARSLGTFQSTAYCGCSICCGPNAKGITASGTRVQAGRTIAVDPKVIPLGSKVLVNGKQYIAEDTGSAIKGNIVDVYFDNHQTALNWGRKNVDVKIVK